MTAISVSGMRDAEFEAGTSCVKLFSPFRIYR